MIRTNLPQAGAVELGAKRPAPEIRFKGEEGTTTQLLEERISGADDLLPLILDLICIHAPTIFVPAKLSKPKGDTQLLEIGAQETSEDDLTQWLSPGYRICLINVLITVTKSLGEASLVSYAKLVVPRIVASFFSFTTEQIAEVGLHFVRAAHLQVQLLAFWAAIANHLPSSCSHYRIV
jgi:hypothetical protein